MMNLDSENNFEPFKDNKLSNYLIAVCEEDQSTKPGTCINHPLH